MRPPKAILLDYGGTLVEEVAFGTRAGVELLLRHATHRSERATLDAILARAARVTREVAARREETHVETPWPALTRLIHDYFGTSFDAPLAELEIGFWDAAATTRAMPGARDALDAFHRAGLPLAVVSNSSFGSQVIRHELDKHGLAEHLAFVMVSAEYAVRKPNVLLFETAAARLGVQARDIWFVGDRLDTDIAGAHAAGMTTVWLRPVGALQSDVPDLSVGGWAEVRVLFERMSA